MNDKEYHLIHKLSSGAYPGLDYTKYASTNQIAPLEVPYYT